MLKKIIYYTCLFVAIHVTVIIVIGFQNNAIINNEKLSIGVVFGNTVNKDGTISNRLKARLDTAIRLHGKGVIQKIFVSGGLGKEGFYEGDKMAEYLILHKIPKSDIVIDNGGNTTKDTIYNSLEYSSKNNISKIVAVSQYFHLARIKFFYHKYGDMEFSTAAPLYFEFRDLYSIPREIVAIYGIFLE